MVLRRAVLGLVAAYAGLGAAWTLAQGIIRTQVSDREGGAARAVFGPETPAIVVTAWWAGLPDASPLEARWVAEDVAMAPPDYLIASMRLPADGNAAKRHVQLTRPRAFWPVGHYRVELAQAGQPAATARFQIAR